MAADGDGKKLMAGVFAVASTLMIAAICAGVSAIWSLNTSVVKLESSQAIMLEQVTSLQSQLTSNVASRYTGEEARADRTSLLEIMANQATILNEATKAIGELRVFQARVEERLKMGTP